ncbi:MAG: DUF1064 domain-containing protein [Rhizorhabdus sp.]|uniref:DUF1064 domain-containing protein n=1 Tax=Rhizorhabdus sp. TaxID=1968843 RepID=UPI001B411917|nr:DUF1064 domain-containing protein [Rhizorhabdus sp.]MBP8235326.1 DUF1064 domain-containing protein [Rhizorhabdus sp.]
MSAAEYRDGKSKIEKPRKFRNEPIVVDGRRYASKREAAYCEELIQLEKAGRIGGLELQKRFELLGPTGEVICVYVADAAFWDHERDRFRVIDVKGVETEAFQLKRKMMRALKGIDVEVVR